MADDKPPVNVDVVNAHNALTGNNTFNAPVTFAASSTTPPTPPPNLHNLPPLTSRFVERPDELNAVHAILTANTHRGASLRAGFRGHGGQGKSTLALAYAWKCRDAAHPWHNTYPGDTYIISCGAGNEGQASASILAEVAALAPACGAMTEQDSRQTAANVKAALERGQLSLVILDNVTSADQWLSDEFAALLPTTNCRYLITTRAAHLADIEEVPVGYLTPAQAIKLLDNYKKIGTTQAEQAAAASIADWLGGLAVALAAVGSMLRRTPSSTYAAYWNVLQAKPVIDLPGGDPATAKEIMYQGRAATVIDDAYDALGTSGTAADSPEQRALQYAALLPQDMIPRPWLIALLEADAERDPAQGGITMTAAEGVPLTPARNTLQRLLDDATLTTKDETGNLLALHRLWHARVNERVEAEKRDVASLWLAIAACANARRAVIVVGNDGAGDGTIDNPAALTDQSLRWELTPLATVCAVLWQQANSAKDASDEAARVSFAGAAAGIGVWLAAALKDLGRYVEASVCLADLQSHETAVEVADGAGELAMCYSVLALIQRNQGEFAEALASSQRAIALLEKHRPLDYAAFANSYNTLATVQCSQGELAAASVSMERAIAFNEKFMDEDHPVRARDYSNLAVIQLLQGHFALARASLERAIAIEAKHFAPDHPHVAISYHNLADITIAQGNIPEAVALWRKSYAIFLKVFGPDHPATKADAAMLRKYDPTWSEAR